MTALHAPLFETLRSLCHQLPTVETWQLLYELFEAWPVDQDRAMGVSYAQNHLKAWPTHLQLALFGLPDEWEGSGQDTDYFWDVTFSPCLLSKPGEFLVQERFETNRSVDLANYKGHYTIAWAHKTPALLLHFTQYLRYMHKTCTHPQCGAEFYYNSMNVGMRWERCTRNDCSNHEVPAGWRTQPIPALYTTELARLEYDTDDDSWSMVGEEFFLTYFP